MSPRRTLVFTCKPRPFQLPKRVRCHSEHLGRLAVEERRTGSKVRPYTLRFSSTVHTREDVALATQEAFDIAHDLDRIWAYVCGVPLFPKILTLRLVNAPEGWKGNAQRVRQSLPARGPYAITALRGRRRFWVELPYAPLKPAMQALHKYRVADEATRHLIELHYATLTATSYEPRLVLLAKCLELTRAMLPGRNDAARQRHLPEEVTNRLKASLHWLFDISNRRVEVRHVVRNPTALELHPKLSSDESKAFRHDSDLVIRGVIAQRLGIDLVLEGNDSSAT